MTLTPDDIKRPAVIRLNRVINTLTGIVWLPLAWVCWAVGMLAVGLDNAFEWSFDKAITLREYLLEAFVKRWPTVHVPICCICGEPVPEGGTSLFIPKGIAHSACCRTASFEPTTSSPYREMTPEEVAAQRNSWGAGYSEGVDKARAAGIYRDTVPA